MQEIGDDKDGAYSGKRIPGRMYISRRFAYKGKGSADP